MASQLRHRSSELMDSDSKATHQRVIGYSALVAVILAWVGQSEIAQAVQTAGVSEMFDVISLSPDGADIIVSRTS